MKKKTDNLSPANLVRRATSPTPPFWKQVRKYSLIIGGITAGLLTLPVSLPAAVVTGATILGSIAGTAAAVAQLTKDDHDSSQDK